MKSGPLLSWRWLASAISLADASTLLVVNRGSMPAEALEPFEVITPGKAIVRKLSDQDPQQLVLKAPSATVKLEKSRYAVVVLQDTTTGLSVNSHDANILQLELSSAAHACSAKVSVEDTKTWTQCLAEITFNGALTEKVVAKAFKDLWDDRRYWSLCNEVPPAMALSTRRSKYGFDTDILRESPLVATVRGFLGAQQCKDVMNIAKLDELTRATVGAVGGTSTSEARETLTTNMFVDWDVVNELSITSARSFNFVSELLGTNLSYEGQEPVNFLHYINGYEYKPHMDGGEPEILGKRVATTLIYCEVATEGGGTVFPAGEGLRFQPGRGDLLYFEYAPQPPMALHAACPVIVGNKSTLTQWYRLGVSPEKPWDLFENWGRFHNLHAESRWSGPRYEESLSQQANPRFSTLTQANKASSRVEQPTEVASIPEAPARVASEQPVSVHFFSRCVMTGVLGALGLYLALGKGRRSDGTRKGKKTKKM